MSSRDDILSSIRANLPRVDRPLPYVPAFDGNPPASLLDAFKDSLQEERLLPHAEAQAT